eukprot:bmy_20954T0
MELWRTGLLVPKGCQCAHQALQPRERRQSGRDSSLNPRVVAHKHGLYKNSPQSTQGPPSSRGLVFVPGTTQLTAKDILRWLQASKVKCTVASEEVIPAVESIVSECPGLKTKFLLSPHSQNRWLSFQELFHIFQDKGNPHFKPTTLECHNSKNTMEEISELDWSAMFSHHLGAHILQNRLCRATAVWRQEVKNQWPFISPTPCNSLFRYKFKKLRHCLMGGEPLNPEGIICANQKGQEIKPGSVGKGVLPYDVQVVKAFVVLSAPFKSSNPEKLTLELQDHVKKTTAPYKYPRKASIVHKS